MPRLSSLHLPRIVGLLVFAVFAVLAVDIGDLRQPITDALLQMLSWLMQPVIHRFQESFPPAPAPSPPLG